MAEADPTPPTLTREQRLAALVVVRHDLRPPVPVNELASQLADVEFDSIPGDCDAVVLGLTSAARPLIVMERFAPKRRQRFTLAHEIGHIILPWHTGSTACDTESSTRDPAETEANRFAAELLVPSRWLMPVVAEAGGQTVRPILDEVRQCNVSIHVAALRVVAHLPPGWIFVLSPDGSTVELSGRSPGTFRSPPVRGRTFSRDEFTSFAAAHEQLSFAGRTIDWFFFGPTKLTSSESDPREWREILATLVARYTEDEADAQRLSRSLNSIVGYAHGLARQDPEFSEERLLGYVQSRFAGRDDLPAGLSREPDLKAFLRKKVEYLAQRR